jgi:hypothetical protein
MTSLRDESYAQQSFEEFHQAPPASGYLYVGLYASLNFSDLEDA